MVLWPRQALLCACVCFTGTTEATTQWPGAVLGRGVGGWGPEAEGRYRLTPKATTAEPCSLTPFQPWGWDRPGSSLLPPGAP